MSTLTLARFQQLMAAYGSQPPRWPEAERAPALRFLETSPAAMALWQEAARLDALLDQVQPQLPSPALLALVVAGADPSPWQGWIRQLWPFGSPWPPLVALACSALLGLALGIVAPTSNGEEMVAWMDDDVIQLAYGVDWEGEEIR